MGNTQLAMVIDAAGCIDCKACQIACKVANNVPDGAFRNWIKSDDLEAAARERKKIVFQPGNCMHCDRPTCVEACPTGATYKDQRDGTVVINRDLCIGCGQCLPACPYGARYRNSDIKKADKCDFCADRRQAGLLPACVVTCPNKTRVFGDLNDPDSDAARLLKNNKFTRLAAVEADTLPNIYFINDPGPQNWPGKAEMPSALAFWKNLAGPAVNAVFGLTAVGVLAMMFKQIMMPKDPPVDGKHDDEGGGHA